MQPAINDDWLTGQIVDGALREPILAARDILKDESEEYVRALWLEIEQVLRSCLARHRASDYGLEDADGVFRLPSRIRHRCAELLMCLYIEGYPPAKKVIEQYPIIHILAAIVLHEAIAGNVSGVHQARDLLRRRTIERLNKGRRNSHRKDREAKDDARDIASTSWREDQNEPIEELVSYIKTRLQEGGYKTYTPETIGGWIKDLAPPDVRPRRGRPKRKTTQASTRF